MDHRKLLIIKLFLLSSVILETSAEIHSLQYLYMVSTQRTRFPEFIAVGIVDGQQFEYYDSNRRALIPKMEWVKKIEGSDYWKNQEQEMDGEQEELNTTLTAVLQKLPHTAGIHVLQRMYGCEFDDNGTTEGYDQYGYDGEDFISLDLRIGTWTAAINYADIIKPNLIKQTEARKSYLKNDCIEWLKEFLSRGGSTLERKDRPEVSMLHKLSNSPELVCHTTGFFPKGLMMSWQKDGEEMHEDVDVRETVPNQDRTFQKRAVLRVSPEELKEHEYTCVVQHSSLEKDLVLKAPAPDGGSLDAGAIAGIVLAGVALVVAVGVLIWKKKKKSGRGMDNDDPNNPQSAPQNPESIRLNTEP